MPKVYISENDRLLERFVSWVYGQMKVKRIPQRVIAEEMEISQPAFAQKLKNRSFTFKDFIVIIRVLDPDSEELNRLVGR